MKLWHPYQKLWNDDLLDLLQKIMPVKRWFYWSRKLVILTDTMLMRFRVNSRISKRTKAYKSLQEMEDVPVYLFDLGTHKKGEEAVLVINEVFEKYGLNYRVFSFEASPSIHRQAQETLKPYAKMEVINLALCEEIPEGGVLKLYNSGNDLGNTLFGSEEQEFEEVKAERLSTFIQERGLELDKSVNLLRMNIEGAEYGVLKDLEAANLLRYFNGFYGTWDDLAKKTSEEKQQEIKRLLTSNNISSLTFNGRDMHHDRRKEIILADIRSAVLSKRPNA
ncbi:MAG: FkbM family methyltransferase [Leptolyngbya sp. SIO3F4]|nr:FkbM family methyltransferase [Leptolyngbya sp. SIO3F4]